MGLIRAARGLPKLMLDCGFHSSPRFAGIGLPAIGLHVAGVGYCYRHETDGRLPGDVRRLSAALSLQRAEVEPALAELLEQGVWCVDGEDVVIQNWADDHPSSAELEAQRARKQRAAQQTNHKRWHVDKGVVEPECYLCSDRSAIAPPIGARTECESREESSRAQRSSEEQSAAQDQVILMARAQNREHDDLRTRFSEACSDWSQATGKRVTEDDIARCITFCKVDCDELSADYSIIDETIGRVEEQLDRDWGEIADLCGYLRSSVRKNAERRVGAA